MAERQIGIAEALAASQITRQGAAPKYFSVTFYKDDGSISVIRKASRNVKGPVKSAGAKTNLRANDLMLVFDHDANTHKYITISLIRTYNGVRVFH